MALRYTIRNKEGYLTAAVDPRVARKLIEEYIGIWIFPGSYMEMD